MHTDHPLYSIGVFYGIYIKSDCTAGVDRKQSGPTCNQKRGLSFFLAFATLGIAIFDFLRLANICGTALLDLVHWIWDLTLPSMW